jgi:hypothetical protein
MPNNLGFQVEEERGPDQHIARLDAARTAFVGRTLRGPVNRAVALHSFAQFQQIFGGLWQPSTVAYAVEQFFDNGGREAWVVRVVNGARSASLSLSAGGGFLRLQAVRPGTREFLRASVDYDNIPSGAPEFNLTVQRVRMQGTEQVEDQEIHARLSMLPGDERYVATALAESQLVQLAGEVPLERPNRTLDATSGLATRYVVSSAGDDGDALTDYDIIGSERDCTGLHALDAVDYFNWLCIPPLTRDKDVGLSTLLVAARYCKERRALLIVDPPSAWHTADEALRGLRRWDFATENAVMYFPRILAHDKLRGHFESFAPCGAVAGMLARADEAFPVWGSEKPGDAILRPGFRPCCLVGEDRRMRLSSMGVNTIQAVRSATRIGVAPRTLAMGSAGNAAWADLASRRLALFILNCVERGTRWIVHSKPHVEVSELAARQVREFFEHLHEAGAFGERSAAESFFVLCEDSGTSDADAGEAAAGDADAGEFEFVIGFAAPREGEFHRFRISHSVSGSKVSPCPYRSTLADYSPEELDWVDRLATRFRGVASGAAGDRS